MPAPGSPPPHTRKKKIVWVRGVMCCVTQTYTLTVAVKVVLQCTSCFYECRCMSDGVFIQHICQLFNLMVNQIEVCHMFVCIFVVNGPISSMRFTWSLTSLFPCLYRLEISTLCCAFACWSWGSGLVPSKFKLN